MKERPILFAGPMVRALVDGSKTQTRRACKLNVRDGMPEPEWASLLLCCPFGQPGDRLWVRENGWQRPPWRTPKMMREGADTWERYYYDADGITDHDVAFFKECGFKRRPSIRMPRRASRITLKVTGVRVERLQDISEADALAEGVCTGPSCPAYDAYEALWGQLNGPGSWAANPWV